MNTNEDPLKQEAGDGRKIIAQPDGEENERRKNIL